MDIMLNVAVNGVRGIFCAGLSVPDVFKPCFEPLRSGDIPIISALEREAGSAEVEHRMQLRSDAAKILADDIAKLIASEMGSKDTHNGYKIHFQED